MCPPYGCGLSVVADGRIPPGDATPTPATDYDYPDRQLGYLTPGLLLLLVLGPESLDQRAVQRHRRAWRPRNGPSSRVAALTTPAPVGLLGRLIGLGVVALAVALHRVAIRMTLAHPSAEPDGHAPILYLRSFGDDRLSLRVVPIARRTFLERLSSRRKQSFEEIIAEDLQRRSPVAAVGEPGRRQTPIGFVRQSVPGDEWQSRVLELIMVAEIIVVVVGLGEGLRWEIRALARTGEWRRALFVFPPVEADDLRDRRLRLADLLAGNGFTGAGVPDPWTPAMIVALDRDESCHYWTAEHINAWSYKAALDDAVRFLGQASATSESAKCGR